MGSGDLLCLACAALYGYCAKVGWRLWVSRTSGQPRYFVSYDIRHAKQEISCERCKFEGINVRVSARQQGIICADSHQPEQCFAATRQECEGCKKVGVTCTIQLPSTGATCGYSSELMNAII